MTFDVLMATLNTTHSLFYVLLVFVAVCSVFWLFWFSCQYLPSDWLERLLRGSLTAARDCLQKPRPNSAYDFLGLFYCFTVEFMAVLFPT